jgi:hypothetical protein
MLQKTALNQRLRQSADGCPGQAGALRQIAISQQIGAWPKRSEYLYATLQ